MKRHNGSKRVISTYTLASAEGVVVHNGLSNNVSKTVNYRRVENPPPPPPKKKNKKKKSGEFSRSNKKG